MQDHEAFIHASQHVIADYSPQPRTPLQLLELAIQYRIVASPANLAKFARDLGITIIQE